MADNVEFQTTAATPPAGTVVSTEEVTTLNGGSVTAQQVQRVALALRTADATAVDLPGDATNGIDVDVTRIQGTVTIAPSGGTLTIAGDVGITGSVPVTDGGGSLTVDGAVTATLGAGTANIGDVDVLTLPALPAGTNNIGDVDVLTLPAGTVAGSASLPAGTNNIGDVDVASSVLPTGAATEATLDTLLTETDFDTKVGALTEGAPASDTASSGLNGRLQRIAQRLSSLIALLPAALVSGRLDVNLGAAPATVTVAALPAGTNNIGDVDVLTLPAGTVAGGSSLPAGTNNIGDVDVLSLPALPAGTNNIGDVDVLTLPAVGGYTDIITATLTRPADTTAYAAGDEITDTGGAIRTLTGMARTSGGTGTLRGLYLAFSSNWATKPQVRVWLYDTTSTPQTDNTAFAPSDGVQATALGYVELYGSAVGDQTPNTGSFAMDSGPLDLPFKCVGSANLYARLQILNAGQAGANSDTITLRARVQQD